MKRHPRLVVLALSTFALVTLYGGRRLYHRQVRAQTATKAPSKGDSWRPPRFTVPQTHPRLWWNAERLARGREWAKKNGLDVRQDDRIGQALRYLLLGDKDAGVRAVSWLTGVTLDTSRVSSDEARWSGEDAMLIYDWCHDLLNAEQRKVLIARWNGYIDVLNKKDWGGIGMEGNNYYWGYLRNGLEWALASYHENPMAPRLLAHALEERFGASFVPYARGAGRGGVLSEGSQYGQYIPGYATVPFVSAANFGVNMWDASDFFKEVVFSLIYNTTPAPTLRAGSNERHFELFPFNDDEKFREEPGGAERPLLALYMHAAAEQWGSAPVGEYAQAWLDLVRPKAPDLVRAWRARQVKPRSFAGLPLDYFAPGVGVVSVRNAWGPGASLVHLQLGRPANVGHEHVDWGTFQIWRNGRWLSRETVGYSHSIANWKGGPPPAGEATIICDKAIAHNSLLFEGMGPRTVGYRKGNPKVVRLESRPDYAYAAVDMGDSYRCTPDCRPARDENPFAKDVVREFLYVRPLEALLVFDRMQASDEQKSPRDVVKTFLLHAETKPAVEGNRLLIKSGDQALRVWTLLPSSPKPRVVEEGGEIGQFRVEIDTSGAPLSHFLHVLQSRAEADPDLTVSFADGQSDVRIKLAHPVKGSAEVVLRKGLSSVGGQFGYAKTGAAKLTPLTDQVQTVTVTSNGPVWR